MRVLPVEEAGGADVWDAYVGPRATTVTDLSAWRRVVGNSYGLRSWFLTAVEGERTVGALGLYEARHPIFGHYLATAPFGNDGGFHFDGEAARDALLEDARTLADDLKVEYLVVRSREVALQGFQVDAHYQTAVIDLSGGADAVWNERLDKKARNQIRKARKQGFTVSAGHSQRAAFHEVFHRHMRALGSPAHSARFYEAIVEQLGERAEFFVLRDGEELVAGALLFWVNGVAMNLHTVALREYNHRVPGYLLYWTMIEAACDRECTRFDMGRSESDSSNAKFKLHWGPELLTLNYNYHLVRAKAVPDLDPRNPKYRLPIFLWQRLPLALTKRLGPRMMPGLL